MRTTLAKHSDLSSLSNSEFNQRFGDKLAITLRELKPWIIEAHRRIEDGELVQGCKTKAQLANVIGRHPSTIEKLVAGREVRHSPLDSNQVAESEPIDMVPVYAPREISPTTGPTCDPSAPPVESSVDMQFLNAYQLSIDAEDPRGVALNWLHTIPAHIMAQAYIAAKNEISEARKLDNLWEFINKFIYKKEIQ